MKKFFISFFSVLLTTSLFASGLLVETVPETDGECPNGGIKILVGTDEDDNGHL